jgi:hypothetical protein
VDDASTISGRYPAAAVDGDTNVGSVHVAFPSGAECTLSLVGGPLVFEAPLKLVPDDLVAGDTFGFGASLSGDSLLVGAGQRCGYVYVRDGATWTLQQALVPDDVSYGSSVALDGDTALVAASVHNAVYVFERVSGVWTQTQRLSPPDVAPGMYTDYFGHAVALDGDTALIASVGDDDNGESSGSCYVYVRASGTWTLQQKLLPADGAAWDHFGLGIALEGDRAFIGAPHDNSWGSPRAGGAYVFERSGTTWTQTHRLVASDTAVGDWFGFGLEVDGDTLVVGSPYSLEGGVPTGAGYVFELDQGVWTEQQRVVPGDGISDGKFGIGIGLEGDTALVSAMWDDDNGAQSGSVYVFLRSSGTWAQAKKLVPSDGASGDELGYQVCVSGDVVVVGCHGDDDSGSSSGSAYIW